MNASIATELACPALHLIVFKGASSISMPVPIDYMLLYLEKIFLSLLVIGNKI